jgi:hypothetical protein
MKYFFFFLLTFKPFISISQVIEWSFHGKGVGAFERAHTSGTWVTTTDNGSTYLLGFYTGDIQIKDTILRKISSISDKFLLKTGKTGEIIWVKQIDGPAGNLQANQIIVDYEGNLLLIGTFSGTIVLSGSTDTLSSSGAFAPLVAKLTPDGDVLWAKKVGEPAGKQPWVDIDAGRIATDSSGNIYFSGSYNGIANFYGNYLPETKEGYNELYAAKLDKNGNFQWVLHLGEELITVNSLIACDNSGNVYVAARKSFLWKINTGGSLVWKKDLQNDWRNEFLGFESGELYLIQNDFQKPTRKSALIKFDKDGNETWRRDFPKEIILSNFKIDKSNNFFVCGIYYSDSYIDGIYLPGNERYGTLHLIKMDSLGKVQWIQTATCTWGIGPGSMGVDTIGNIYLAGSFTGVANIGENTYAPQKDGSSVENAFLMKVRDTTETFPVSVEIKKNDTSFNIFPNPTTCSFTIETDLLEIKAIIIRNITGSILFIDENSYSGMQYTNLNLSPGIYFIELQTENERMVKKLVISR